MRALLPFTTLPLVAAVLINCGSGGDASPASDPNDGGGGTSSGSSGSGDPHDVDDGGAAADGAGAKDGGAGPAAPICSKDNWCWDYPTPQGNDLGAISADGPNDVWAAGANGTVLHDVGSGFVREAIASNATMIAVHRGFVVSEVGEIFRRDATGFTLIGKDPSSAFVSTVWATSPTDAWVGGNHHGQGVMLHYDGVSFTETTIAGAANKPCLAVDAIREVGGKLFVTCSGGVFSRSAATFVEETLPDRHYVGLGGTAANDLWAFGRDAFGKPATHRYDGTAWAVVPFPATEADTVVSFDARSTTDAWALTAKGKLAHFDGTAWTITPSPTLANGLTMTSLTAHTKTPLVVGTSGLEVGWDGKAWTANLSTGFRFVDAAGSSSSDVLALSWTPKVARSRMSLWRRDAKGWSMATEIPVDVGTPKAIARAGADTWILGSAGLGLPNLTRWSGTTFTQTTWKPKPASNPDLIWGAAANDLWVAGRGTLAHWDGTSFTEHIAPFGGSGVDNVLFYGLFGSASNDVWAVGTGSPQGGGLVFPVFVHWDGTSWSAKPVPNEVNNPTVYGFARGPSDAWFSTTTGLAHWDGTAITLVNKDIAFGAVWADSPTNVYASSDKQKKIFHFDGKTWTPQEIEFLPGALVGGGDHLLAVSDKVLRKKL